MPTNNEATLRSFAQRPKTKKIRRKWSNQQYIFRFLDGTYSCVPENLQPVRLEDALRNPNWACDWDTSLTGSEVEYVHAHREEFISLYEAHRRGLVYPTE